jgi:hypothetical protein
MSYPPLLNGPIPPYTNPPINPQYYLPSRFVISAISLGTTTTVTTTVNHNYVIGQQCRLIIPPGYGCTALSEQSGFVITIPAANQVVLTTNSEGITPFINISSNQQPQILAIGDINTGAVNALGNNLTSTFIPGSFIDVSPN